VNSQKTESHPIFVTGADRSGTTLMYQLLGSHPNISMVRRTNMFRWFYGRYGDLDKDHNLDRALDDLLSYQRLAVLRPSRSDIIAELSSEPITDGRLFDVLHSQEARRRGKPRWGDKSLHHEHCAEDILSEFPQATIIHIVRDPRDRFASASRRYAARDKSASSIAGRWIESALMARANTRQFGDRYLVVRFEDLVRETRTVLHTVCDTIGEAFDDAMFDMQPDVHESANSDPNSSFDDISPRTISDRPVGRFADVLTEREIAFVEFVSLKHMRHFGYETRSTRLTSLAKHPKNQLDIVRTRLWRMRFKTAGNDGPPPHRLESRTDGDPASQDLLT
jgi:hypothetical protein